MLACAHMCLHVLYTPTCMPQCAVQAANVCVLHVPHVCIVHIHVLCVQACAVCAWAHVLRKAHALSREEEGTARPVLWHPGLV